MLTRRFWARLEDEKGRVQGPDPAWAPERQFLWEVVHDNRGMWRLVSTPEEHLELVRKIDASQGQGGKEFLLDPSKVRAAYERFLSHVSALGETQPRFRLVAPRNADTWAVVTNFEEAGTEYALVGGWTGPVLRRLQPEPDLLPVEERDEIAIGSKRFRLKAVPFAEYFRTDFDSLLRLLEDAERRGLRIRFLQA